MDRLVGGIQHFVGGQVVGDLGAVEPQAVVNMVRGYGLLSAVGGQPAVKAMTAHIFSAIGGFVMPPHKLTVSSISRELP